MNRVHQPGAQRFVGIEDAPAVAPFGRDARHPRTGEHDGVGAAQDRQVGAQVLAGPVTEGIHRQAGPRVVLLVREQVPHVAAPARQAEQPGALVEPSLHLWRGHVLHAREIADERGIDIARPGSHHEAFQGRQAHGGVDRSPVLDRGRRAAVSQVERDEGRALERNPVQLDIARDHRAVGKAVKTVASNAVLRGQLVGDGVAIGVLGHRGVKGRIEDGDHGDIGAERGSGCPHARKARGVVQRRQGLERFDRLQHVGVDQDRLREARAPVDHAVSDRVDPDRTSALGRTARAAIRAPADCGLMVRDPLALASRWAPFGLEREGRRVPDALDETARQAPYVRRPRTGVTGKDLELERRAAAVEGQDVHGSDGGKRWR